MKFPVPENEEKRVQTLHDLQVLDSLPSPVFDSITELAASICGTEIALISLVDADRQWFKSRRGFEPSETGRDEAFCSHTIMDTKSVLVVNDAARDPRFAQLPLVSSGSVRFYAGAPITTASGQALGAVCVLGQEKMFLSEVQTRQLQHLAKLTMDLIEHEALRRREARRILDLVRKNERIIRNVLDEGREMAAFIDTQHRYLYVNPAFERYWIQSQEALLGTSVQDLVGERLYREVCQVGINQALSGHESILTFELRFPGTGLRRMELHHIPALNDEGRVHGVVERHRDVTELAKQADLLRGHAAELEVRRVAQDRYLHAISHELKQPVNAINNATPVLVAKLNGTLPELERKCLTYIERGGRRLARLLEDMRLFGELDGRTLAVAPHNVRALLEESLMHLRDDVEQRRATVDLQVDGDLSVDAPVFELAVRCLLEYSLWSSAKTPAHIVVRLVKETGESRLEVIDVSAANPLPVIRSGRVDQQPIALPASTLSVARQVAVLHGGALLDEPTEEGWRCLALVVPREVTHAV
ncbi:sensory box protein [Hydrogenophaga sp. RAC07]|uniref:PAS domain-containing protein n=1 Tax=Hydrogenophaga sp. RAC07 TaxID=1842537 RepID=UPI00083CABA1|nr:PAS domain-containing protein [Hydrogenophaga sp. RAC07]AOF86083.1 sensory box protein [Hydrogenophaga sp. RAC07]